MNTPIADFVYNYNIGDFTRFHMPGHKGRKLLGFEEADITEIDGADVLYCADGIINESENNASSLFGTAHTYYSTEGSSLAIKAMLSLVCSESEDRPLILAARNAHKAFIYAAALIDFDIQWMYGETGDHLCKCTLTAEMVAEYISRCPKKPTAVYITSPDYLGNVADIRSISEVCDKHGIPLLVDNAHGAYLAFGESNEHPIALGASMCCDSAHKTLPCLTGGAYLHIGKKAEKYCENARAHLSLFASTSPSYLILQSLDLCNRYISDSYREKLKHTVSSVQAIRRYICDLGFTVSGQEQLKLTLDCNSFGYSGQQVHSHLIKNKICCEYYDSQYIVFMFSPENTDSDFDKLKNALSALPKKESYTNEAPCISVKARSALSVRQAIFSKSQTVPVSAAKGRICADPSVSCPPAVPIVVSGEMITDEHISLMQYYGVQTIKVIV